jgi:hypothetical protein
MSIWTLPKQPAEIEAYTLDFATSRFKGSESGSSQVTSAVLMDDGTDATATVIDSSSMAAGVVTVVVKAGTHGKNYKLTTRVTTDAGNVYESDVMLKVREK